MKSVTIKDISRIASVSPMTVSRVVNKEKHVKRETRGKVIRAIKQYGYEPNYFARSLKTRRSKTIGFIIGDIENPYYSRLSKGVIDTAEDADYNVMVCNSKYSPNAELERVYPRAHTSEGQDPVHTAGRHGQFRRPVGFSIAACRRRSRYFGNPHICHIPAHSGSVCQGAYRWCHKRVKRQSDEFAKCICAGKMMRLTA